MSSPLSKTVIARLLPPRYSQTFSDGSIFPFFSRPVAAVLAAMTMAALFWSVGVWLWQARG